MKIRATSVKTIVKRSRYVSIQNEKNTATNQSSERKKNRSKVLLNCLKSGTNAGEIISSDKKMFMIEEQFNIQNNKNLSKSADDIPNFVKDVYHCQKPSQSWCGLPFQKPGRTPLIFFNEGAKINSNFYINFDPCTC